MMGSAVAYFMLYEAPGTRVAVVEPDPTYELASTPRASGGARRLFSCAENVAMSTFAVAELIVHGRFRTIDLGRLGYARVIANEPYPEHGII